MSPPKTEFHSREKGSWGRPGQKSAREAALREREERLDHTLALCQLIPWVADHCGQMTEIDPRGLQLTGLSLEDCLRSGFLSAIHSSDRRVILAAWAAAKLSLQAFQYEVRIRLADQSYRWHRCRAIPKLTDLGSVRCWYGTIEDIDEKRSADRALRWTADHDDLTGILNRRAFMASLEDAIGGVRGTGVAVALLLLDLDGFKLINDCYGHDAGDLLLVEVARRLGRVGCGDAIVGRLGGDEFAIALYVSDPAEVPPFVDQLRHDLCISYDLGGQHHLARASAGIAMFPNDAQDVDSLYKDADLALYEAKNAGVGVSYFETSMRDGLQARMSQLALAREALEQGQVYPYYQPKVDLRSGAVMGFEALLRWGSPAQGTKSPRTIAAALQDAELSISLDERMFERVARDIAHWEALGIKFGRIAVNVSSAEFRLESFADAFLDRIARAGILPSNLELEITETVFLGRDSTTISETIRRLRSAGMTIALDDFGTGYASLVHLKQFPVDVLKIDRSFVQTLDDPVNAAIVHAIVTLGRDLGIATVAEGVETEEQAHRLYERGCDLGQGYLFSRAIAADRVPALLALKLHVW